MTEPALNVLISVNDIRCPGSTLTTVELKAILTEIGFSFEGPIDEKGRQQATLPDGWEAQGDISSTNWNIVDSKHRKRIEVRSKIPWGHNDHIHFLMLELSNPRVTDPRIGW